MTVWKNQLEQSVLIISFLLLQSIFIQELSRRLVNRGSLLFFWIKPLTQKTFIQLAIVMRYGKTDRSVEERFLGYKNVSENQQQMKEYIDKKIERKKYEDKKLVAPIYDGAVVMVVQ